MRRHLMTAWVDVDGGFEGFDESRLVDSPFDPVTFIGHDSLVFYAEVMAIVVSMLEHCRLVLA